MANAEQLITENLDLWSSAVKAKSSAGRGSNKKLELYGIRKLRGLILDLAVQGKLVPQNLKDQHADDLIKDVKESLPNRKSSNPFLREIGQEVVSESNYDLPRGWAWLPLGNIGIWATGCGFPKKFQGEIEKEFLFCKVSDMNLEGNEVEIRATANTIDSITLATIKGKANPIGTIIFPKIGGAIATHKRRIICKPTLIDNNCSGIQPIGLTVNRWLLILMQSLDLTKYQSGTSVPAVSQSTLDPIRVGIPPLAEQHRIVAKVDELMALCDQLEEEQENNFETHKMLVSTLLNALTSAASDSSQFAEAWLHIQSNFDILFTTENSVDQLKQTILQLAVMGKLIPQDMEKEQILDSVADKIHTSNIETTAPLELPPSWIWSSLNQLADVNGGFAFKSGNYNSDGTRVVRISDFDEYGFKSNKIVRHEFSSELEKFRLLEGDILMAMTGGTVGKSFHIKSLNEPMVVNQRVATIRAGRTITSHFLHIVIQSKSIQEEIAKAKNSTNDNISMKQINSFHVPLPPLAEQHRIVAKVDELIALCDQLKANLASVQVTQFSLADSLVEQAIS